VVAPAGRRTLLAGSCGISRSRDGGRTWATVLACPAAGGREIERFLFDRNPNLVYAMAIDSASGPLLPRSCWSADGGTTWRPLVADGGVLAVDPTRSGRLYVTRTAGLARSDDGGLTFRTISSFAGSGSGQDVRALLVDPATPSTLYAAVFRQGVFRSTDGGVTWAPINAGLTRYGNTLVLDLVLDPVVPHRLFVLEDSGILVNQLTIP
jgi:hypothetical protein